MKRKEKVDIICRHLRRVMIASNYEEVKNYFETAVMYGIKEIEESKKKDEYDEITVRYNKIKGSINHKISILGWKGERSYSLLEDTDNSCVTVITKDTFKMKEK